MKRTRLAIMLIIAAVMISAGVWWYVNSISSEASTDILTSGFIEARDTAVALEAGGRIVEIAAEEGDRVEAGVTLVKLDDSLLKAQKQQAEANVGLTQAYLEQAIIARDGAKKAWENALDVQSKPLELEARLIAAQGQLDMVALNLDRMSRSDVPATIGSEGAILQWLYWWDWDYRTALLQRDAAKKALDVLLAIRDNPQEINAAVDQAYYAYQTATVAVKTAEWQVKQAEASLEVVEIRLSKFASSSPVSGVVAAKYAEVGEIAQPATPILTITQLDQVTLTAYVPESKIGLVKLGQRALVTVDSYPDDSFSGRVTYISPQAQFTPRNVQLKEEREKTVFAVKISLDNPGQKLKPGMPADARIITISEGKRVGDHEYSGY